MNAAAPVTDHYLQGFAALRTELPGADLHWMSSLREQGLREFARLGFPSTRDEDWKYTNVRALTRSPFTLAGETSAGLVEDDLQPFLISDLQARRLVFVNGRFAPQLSQRGQLPDGVHIESLARVLESRPEALENQLGGCANPAANGFSALNAAYFNDGAVIRIPEGVRMEDPIHVVYVSTVQSEDRAYHLRNHFALARGAQAEVIEHYVSMGDGVYLNNAVTEVQMESGSALDHYKLQEESQSGFHVAALDVRQKADSRFASYSVSVGGALVRNDINAALEAERAECDLMGLYVAGGKQHVDFHTRVDHLKPEGRSREFYRGVLSGRARAVFNGKACVHPDAQKTDAQQSNKNLLLSRDAEVDTKPELEIYADDVSCTHGATVGQLDETMLFYLRSRGVPEEAARGMLTYGFAHDIVERMGLKPIRRRIERSLTRALPNAGMIEVSG